MMVGKEMHLPAEQIKLLGLGGLLHDLGQAEIPDAIKNKTEPWTASEAATMRKHCAWGVALGKRLGLPAEVLLIIAQHHEHVDGSGYPGKLSSAQLSPLSRIVAVAESYDQLCNPKNLAPLVWSSRRRRSRRAVPMLSMRTTRDTGLPKPWGRAIITWLPGQN